MNNQLENLYRNCWETRGARFNAFRRLQRRSMSANFIISIVSALLIFVSAIQIPDQNKSLVNLLSISGALVILVVSLWESARNSSVKADRLYNCANKLSFLYRRIKSIRHLSEDKNNIEELESEYLQIINSCSENHEPLDYNFHRIEHFDEYKKIDPELDKKLSSRVVRLKWYFSCFDIALYTILFMSLFLFVGNLLTKVWVCA